MKQANTANHSDIIKNVAKNFGSSLEELLENESITIDQLAAETDISNGRLNQLLYKKDTPFLTEALSIANGIRNLSKHVDESTILKKLCRQTPEHTTTINEKKVNTMIPNNQRDAIRFLQRKAIQKNIFEAVMSIIHDYEDTHELNEYALSTRKKTTQQNELTGKSIHLKINDEYYYIVLHKFNNYESDSVVIIDQIHHKTINTLDDVMYDVVYHIRKTIQRDIQYKTTKS